MRWWIVAALARAQSDIDAQNVHAARADLLVALGEFKQMRHNLTTPAPGRDAQPRPIIGS